MSISNNINNKIIINFFFILIFTSPLFVYIGPALENINVFLILTVGIYIILISPELRKNLFRTYRLEKIITIFFGLILLISLFVNGNYINSNILVKIPYIVIFFILLILINELPKYSRIISVKLFKKLIFFYLFSIYLLIFDIYFQFLFEFNILGMVNLENVTSFFGNEKVAGSYLAKISPIILFLHFKKIIKNLHYIFLLIAMFLAINITTERSAVIIFSIINIFYIFIVLFEKKTNLKNFIIINLFILTIIITGLYINKERILSIQKIIFDEKFLVLSHDPVIYFKDISKVHFYYDIDENVNIKKELGYVINNKEEKIIINFSNLENNKISKVDLFLVIKDSQHYSHQAFLNFFKKSINLDGKIFYIPKKPIEKDNYNEITLSSKNKVKHNYFDSGWGSHNLVALEIFKENIYIGTGPDTFRYKCKEEKYYKINSFNIGKSCTTHPHNLHVEILQGTGIIGYILFLLFIISIYRIQIKYEKVTNKDKLILAIIIISFFPILLPTGSFFSSAMMNKIFITFLIIQIINNYNTYMYEK